MPHYSHSKISCFETCPKQYYYRYIEKPEIEVTQGIEAFMGSMVHDTLEKHYNDLKMTKLNSLKYLLKFYESEWKKNWTDSIVIVKKGLTQKHYFGLGKKCITDYYNRFKPFNQDKTIACEKMVSFTLDNQGKIQMIGYIDRLSEKEPGHYTIHDYKTNGKLPTQQDKDQDRQLALYAIALQKELPDCKKISLCWHFLVFDKDIYSERTTEQLEQLKKETIQAIQKVEKTTEKGEFPAKESRLCGWCAYAQLCPLKKHETKTKALSAKEFKKDDGVKLVEKYVELNGKLKKAKIELNELVEQALAFAEKFELEKISGKDAALKVWKKSGYSFAGLDENQKDEIQEILKKANLLGKFLELNTRGLGCAIEKGELANPLEKKIKKYGKETESQGVRLVKK